MTGAGRQPRTMPMAMPAPSDAHGTPTMTRGVSLARGRRIGPEDDADAQAPGASGADTPDEVAALRETSRARIRQAMAGGDYDGLLAPGLWRLFDAAAGATGFGREIGALRFAMARLLAEEEDPRHLATQLARVTTTIIRATQAHQMTGGTDDGVRSALLTVLDDLETGAPAFGPDDAPTDDTLTDDTLTDDTLTEDGEEEETW